MVRDPGRGGGQFTELSRPLPVGCCARPIVRPRNIAMLAQRDHRFDRERHARFALAHRLVLAVMRHVRGTMEQRVHPVPAVCPDHAAVPGLGMFLDGVSKIPYQGSRLNQLGRLVEALPGRLDHPD